MTFSWNRRNSFVAVFCCTALFLPACGDDGSGGDTEQASGSSGSGSTADSDPTGDPPDTTGEGATGEGSTSTGPGETNDSTATDTSGGPETTETTTGGPVGDCAGQMDAKTCEATEGCLWLGSPMNGACHSDDPAVCPELEMQTCQQHPACEWDNQQGTCDAPA